MRSSFRLIVLVIVMPVMFFSMIIFNIVTRDETCGITLLEHISLRNENIFLYERGCGTTTGVELHLSSLPKDKALGNSSGNLFSANIKSSHLALNDNVFLIINNENKISLKIKYGLVNSINIKGDRVLVEEIMDIK